MQKITVSALLSLVMMPITPLQAHEPAGCSKPGPVPEELSGWDRQKPLAAARTGADAQGAMLVPGEAVKARLSRVSDVRLVVKPQKAGAADSYAGLIAFSIQQPGSYRVATGANLWIDVVRDGVALQSSSHGHGPACSPVSKTVDFELPAGRYLLQLANGQSADLAVMIQRLP